MVDKNEVKCLSSLSLTLFPLVSKVITKLDYDSCSLLYCIVLYCIVLYCIVLCLYSYIALLAVHNNQKRFQWERPREKSLERTKRGTWLTR